MSRIAVAFGMLVLVQAAHSVEEYAGGLWESFPPAAFLTGLIASDRKLGFIVINGVLVAFGVWCLLWPMARRWPSAVPIAWFWIVIETINGIGHPAWSLRQGGYTPGVLTAPILLMLALHLAFQIHKTTGMSRSV
jgi:hypothetical protein